MVEKITQLHEILHQLIGFHRSLLENVRAEREALIAADLKRIQELTYEKESLVESIKQQEQLRVKLVAELSVILRKPLRELTLTNLIILVQGENLKLADQLRNSLTALTTLASRISDQNRANRTLVERSLEHIHVMKRNVLGEATPKSDTYGAQGQKRVAGATSPRFVSKEV